MKLHPFFRSLPVVVCVPSFWQRGLIRGKKCPPFSIEKKKKLLLIFNYTILTRLYFHLQWLGCVIMILTNSVAAADALFLGSLLVVFRRLVLLLLSFFFRGWLRDLIWLHSYI